MHTAIARDGRVLPFSTPGKVFDCQLRPGDTLIIEAAGGGGYGDPLERDPERVRADLAEGYITPTRARDTYGVVFAEDGTVDAAATRHRREQLVGERVTFPVIGGAHAIYAGEVGRRRICRLHPSLAERIDAPEGALIELRGGGGAPLRAWVELDPDQPADAITLDDFALKVLRLEPGDRVWPRRLLANGLIPSAGPTIDRGETW